MSYNSLTHRAAATRPIMPFAALACDFKTIRILSMIIIAYYIY